MIISTKLPSNLPERHFSIEQERLKQIHQFYKDEVCFGRLSPSELIREISLSFQLTPVDATLFSKNVMVEVSCGGADRFDWIMRLERDEASRLFYTAYDSKSHNPDRFIYVFYNQKRKFSEVSSNESLMASYLEIIHGIDYAIVSDYNNPMNRLYFNSLYSFHLFLADICGINTFVDIPGYHPRNKESVHMN